jgi:hypothetical protein
VQAAVQVARVRVAHQAQVAREVRWLATHQQAAVVAEDRGDVNLRPTVPGDALEQAQESVDVGGRGEDGPTPGPTPHGVEQDAAIGLVRERGQRGAGMRHDVPPGIGKRPLRGGASQGLSCAGAHRFAAGMMSHS